MICRSCGNPLSHVFLDLGHAPPSNAFLAAADLERPEAYCPLKAYVCERCLLVQIDECATAPDIFNAGYVYFSSYSEAFVRHARTYVGEIRAELELTAASMVYEAASNDGYLLQFFQQAGIPCCGIEPSRSVAEVAMAKGIETEVEFFNAGTASLLTQKRGYADLFIGNNVMAHVPNLNDFIAGIRIILKPGGVATIEFPHLLHLIDRLEFDTIYHEHYSYFSLLAVRHAFHRHGLEIFHVEEFDVHGGSLRIYAARMEAGRRPDQSVDRVLEKEKAHGMDRIDAYGGFQCRVDRAARDFIDFLVAMKKSGKRVIGYGAAAKGNTLLNYCGVKPYLLDCVVDITPAKQGKYLPGSHIPVGDESEIARRRPDYVVILPWNWVPQIVERLAFVREWDAKFVTAIPEIRIF